MIFWCHIFAFMRNQFAFNIRKQSANTMNVLAIVMKAPILDPVGMLSLEAFVTEDTNTVYGNTMPEFAELEETMILMRMMIFCGKSGIFRNNGKSGGAT